MRTERAVSHAHIIMKIFSIDSPLYRGLTKIRDIFVLNLCWLIGSLPLVTIGVSCVAASDVALKMADEEEGYIARQFFRAYKVNLRQGIPLGIIMAVCCYIVYLDFEFVRASEKGSILLIVTGCVTAFVFLFSFLYAPALTARYVNTLPKILRNSFRISMKFFFRSVLTVLFVGIEVAAILWNYTTMFAGLLMGPALITCTICAMAKPVFKKLENEEKEKTV